MSDEEIVRISEPSPFPMWLDQRNLLFQPFKSVAYKAVLVIGVKPNRVSCGHLFRISAVWRAAPLVFSTLMRSKL